MKVSLYTITLSGGYYGGPPVPLLDIFPLAREWGYDGIELEAKRPHGSPLDLDTEARAAIRQAAADNSLEISCVSAYNDFSSPIEEHRENELLMVREQIRLAAALGAPTMRVMAAWSGVTRRDGAITYDVARYNVDHRYPGTTCLERWRLVRACLREAAAMAETEGIILALQNHKPVVESYRHVLEFIEEVNSPALRACLDAPLLQRHDEAYYREAIRATGELMVHTHFGGRFYRDDSGEVISLDPQTDYPTFMRLAKEMAGFDGHAGYELCSPVLIAHEHAGLSYALGQAQMACEYMRAIIDSLA